MYYIYNISTREIVTKTILHGRWATPIRGTKAEMTKEMNAIKRSNRKSNLVVMSLSKAKANGIDIPKDCFVKEVV